VYTNDVLPPGDQDIILTDIFLDCVSNFAPKYLDKNLWNSSNKLLDALKREKKILTQFRQIWVWSKWMKEWAITHMALSDDKVKVIGIGPTLQPLEKNAPSHDSNPRILFIGNDLYRKGFDLLLGAFSIALEYNKDLQLVAISKNRMPAEFPIEWHTLDPLKFDDERKLSKIIASCTVYVQPSRFEPFGIAYLDAMSHYLPIIGPRAFALKEMITDGITGYYCDLNPESIAANILKILDDKNNLKRMGNSAYKLQQKKYHWPVVIDKINKYLEEN